MSSLPPIRIVIADDHEFFRAGFRRIIQEQYQPEIEFVDEACNGAELVQSVARVRPQLVITDIKMPEMNGIQASKIIKKEYPGTSIIAFSMFDDSSNILNMLQAGASGYLVKSSPKEEVINAIRTVNKGSHYYCSTISEKIYGRVLNSTQVGRDNKTIQFSQQEQKVMQLICKQLSSKEIACSMNLAVRTVENYRHHIQEKIGARNVVGIALYAIVHGVVRYSELL